MLLWMIIKVAVKSLAGNVLRSFLAILGIIMGVAAVIAMLAIGAGAKKLIVDQIAMLGTNMLTMHPNPLGTGGVISGTRQNLTVEDGQQILKDVPAIKAISPTCFGSEQVKYMHGNVQTTVGAVAYTYLSIRAFEIDQGRNFTQGETDHMARVAVIGQVPAEKLFGQTNPVGEMVKIGGINFTIVGLLKGKGDPGGWNMDDVMFVPYTTGMHIILGKTVLTGLDMEAQDGSDLYEVQDEVAACMRRLHHVQPGEPDDVNIHNQSQMLAIHGALTDTFNTLLWCAAGISLVVGGIGIMNVMLVTVTERTREIGIRKAVGARNRDILLQFLIEGVLMSGLGGLLGVGLGVLAASAATWFDPSLKSIVTVSAILVGLISSTLIGICFGLFPAWRAAQLDPIEALRYE